MFRRKKSFLRRSNHQSIIVYITNLTNAYIARCIQAWGGVIMEWPALFIVHIFLNVHTIYIAMQLAFRLGEV